MPAVTRMRAAVPLRILSDCQQPLSRAAHQEEPK